MKTFKEFVAENKEPVTWTAKHEGGRVNFHRNSGNPRAQAVMDGARRAQAALDAKKKKKVK